MRVWNKEKKEKEKKKKNSPLHPLTEHQNGQLTHPRLLHTASLTRKGYTQFLVLRNGMLTPMLKENNLAKHIADSPKNSCQLETRLDLSQQNPHPGDLDFAQTDHILSL